MKDLMEKELEEVNKNDLINEAVSDIKSIKLLDKYLKKNFCIYSEENNKDKIREIHEIVEKSVNFLEEKQIDNKDFYLIRWEFLIELISHYLKSKSLFSVFKSIKIHKHSIPIIIYLFQEKNLVTVTDIKEKLNLKDIQGVTNLLPKLEEIGVIRKEPIGKRRFIYLTALGKQIYKEFLGNYSKNIETHEIKQEVKNSHIIVPSDKKLSEVIGQIAIAINSAQDKSKSLIE